MKGKHGKFPSGRVRRIDPRNLKEEEERPRMSNAKGKKKKKMNKETMMRPSEKGENKAESSSLDHAKKATKPTTN